MGIFFAGIALFQFQAGHPALASCGQLAPQLKQRAVLSGVLDFGGNTALAVPAPRLPTLLLWPTELRLSWSNLAMLFGEDTAKCTNELFEI